MTESFTFSRPQLALTLCEALDGVGFTDATSGLFLAAPRRTGKSTFLRSDLVPAMALREWEALYVDLWSDRSRDPAELIAAVIAEALARHDGPVMKAARKVGLTKVTVGGALTLDLASIGQPGGATLADALERLRQKSGKVIALLIDEAQHALTTERGIQAMFALKAARDRLNLGTDRPGLKLVMTGSNRDKLSSLVLGRQAPFLGATVARFPLLGEDFVAAYAQWLNRQFVRGEQFSTQALLRAFELVGNRPELLKQVVGQAVAELGGARALDEELANNAALLRQRAWSDFDSTWRSLPLAQKAVLHTAARQAPAFEPFAEAAQGAYAAIVGRPLTASGIEGALEALRDKALMWKAGRGNYALEDDGLAAWLVARYPRLPDLGDDA